MTERIPLRKTSLWTRNIGVFVGRTASIIGEVILAYDVSVSFYTKIYLSISR